jgi:hypothetical protein
MPVVLCHGQQVGGPERDRITRYNTFSKDLFEKIIVMSFIANGFKICMLCVIEIIDL